MSEVATILRDLLMGKAVRLSPPPKPKRPPLPRANDHVTIDHINAAAVDDGYYKALIGRLGGYKGSAIAAQRGYSVCRAYKYSTDGYEDTEHIVSMPGRWRAVHRMIRLLCRGRTVRHGVTGYRMPLYVARPPGCDDVMPDALGDRLLDDAVTRAALAFVDEILKYERTEHEETGERN